MSHLCLCDPVPRRLDSLQEESLQEKKLDSEVVRRARGHLERHAHFRSHARAIEVDYQEGRLVLTGRVPSFYLKQVLQTTLRELPGVSRIDNQVLVVSSCGLSSVPGSPGRCDCDEQRD